MDHNPASDRCALRHGPKIPISFFLDVSFFLDEMVVFLWDGNQSLVETSTRALDTKYNIQ